MNTSDQALFVHGLHEEFIDNYFRPDGSRFHVLIAPPGSGKSTVLNSIVELGFADAGYRRVLLVAAPSAHLDEIASELERRLTVPILRVTKSRYRALEAAESNYAESWQASYVGLITTYVLRQPSVLRRMVGIRWDLVGLDDIDLLSTASRAAFSTLAFSSTVRRVVILAVTPNRVGPFASLPDSDVVRWNVEEFLEPHSITYERIEYRREPSEVAAMQRLARFIEDYALKDARARARRLLLSAASSSPYAIQAALLREHHQLTQGNGFSLGTGGDTAEEEPDEAAVPTPGDRMWRRDPQVPPLMVQLIQELDGIQEDEKLDAVNELLSKLTRADPEGRTIILTAHKRTAEYLGEALHSPDRVALAGVLLRSARSRTNDSSRVWVLTDIDLRSIDVSAATSVIHYDLPPTSMAMDRRHGRVLSAARRGHVAVYIVWDTSGTSPYDEDLNKRHRKYLAHLPLTHRDV